MTTHPGTILTDEQMNQLRAGTRDYSVVILHDGPNRYMEGVEEVIWEHGRRVMGLRLDGVISILCPIPDQTTTNGLAIMACSAEEAAAYFDADPCVEQGVFTYRVHPGRSFPGDSLPG